MTNRFKKKLLVAMIASMLLPLVASAADADLMSKIESMSRELEALKAQVKANEEKSAQTAEQVKAVAAKSDTGALNDLKSQVTKLESKSLSKWLTVGGDYRFRYDYLAGESQPFTDVNQVFAIAGQKLQANFFADPTNPQNSAMLSGMMQFSGAMNGVRTYDDAVAFFGKTNPATGFTNQQLLAGIGGLVGNSATVPAYKPKNNSLLSNRFGLDIGAKATQDVSVNAHLMMYKAFGAQDDSATTNGGSAPFFADRVGVFDGTLGHVPSNSLLNVDRVYATWGNIADRDIWFSVGRRPATNGAPSNLRLNTGPVGKGGVPALLVDYAFDGMTLGYAPDIDALPGAYAKICYGRGFESGFSKWSGNSLSDTNMLGVAVVPIDTDPLRVWLQWNRGMNIFDAPTMSNTYFGNTAPKTNLGDIDWFGAGFARTFKKVGPGDLTVFGDAGLSITHPNNNVSAQFGFQGLMTGEFFHPEAPTSKNGTAIAIGMRYDLPSKTKLGLEYNHGSKNWITFAPAADDMWTAKVGARGDVYEAYVIQELDRQPISSFSSKAFFRLGAQYYNFKYTGSNNWVGAPVAIGDVNAQSMMTTTPLKNATNIYATFEVKF
jgi:hypothetical protein